jgi:hypothetical protein
MIWLGASLIRQSVILALRRKEDSLAPHNLGDEEMEVVRDNIGIITDRQVNGMPFSRMNQRTPERPTVR